jgi:hypothetical protein
VSWAVEIGAEFELEFDALHADVQTEILALARLVQQFGPQLGIEPREYEGAALRLRQCPTARPARGRGIPTYDVKPIFACRPYNLLAGRPELIVVVVREHPRQ